MLPFVALSALMSDIHVPVPTKRPPTEPMILGWLTTEIVLFVVWYDVSGAAQMEELVIVLLKEQYVDTIVLHNTF